MVILGNNDGV